MGLKLEHSEFVHLHIAREVKCLVNLSAAMHVCDALPGMGCVWQGSKSLGCLLPLAGIVLMFVTKWWIGLLCIVAGGLWSNGVRATASQMVVKRALEDPVFYLHMVSKGILVVEES